MLKLNALGGVSAKVHKEETLDEINNVWRSISSKLANVPFDDVFNVNVSYNRTKVTILIVLKNTFVKVEEGKLFY